LKANEGPALSGLDAEGIHQMRVALRRMRSAIADIQEIIPAAQVSRLKRETKWLLASLGSARDGDVFLSELLPPVETDRPGDTGLAELRKAAEAERETGYSCRRRSS
jgi:CHAD domain-containing protein